jgi:hypothetical protein
MACCDPDSEKEKGAKFTNFCKYLLLLFGWQQDN